MKHRKSGPYSFQICKILPVQIFVWWLFFLILRLSMSEDVIEEERIQKILQWKVEEHGFGEDEFEENNGPALSDITASRTELRNITAAIAGLSNLIPKPGQSPVSNAGTKPVEVNGDSGSSSKPFNISSNASSSAKPLNVSSNTGSNAKPLNVSSSSNSSLKPLNTSANTGSSTKPLDISADPEQDEQAAKMQALLQQIQDKLSQLEKSKLEFDQEKNKYCEKHGFCLGVQKPKKPFFKKLKIPEGSTLSLDVQLSNPNVLTGLFFQPEGIILDAVLEIPMWIDLAKFATYMYTKDSENEASDSKKPPKPTGRSMKAERCYIYEQLEHYTALFLNVSPAIAHQCFLRTVCELHSMLAFWPFFENASLVFELINLMLTPSLGREDDCHAPYHEAEMTGRKKRLCYAYKKECPISIAAIIISNFVPNFHF